MKKLLLVLFLVNCIVFPQSFKVMTYNILNYPGSDTTTRNPYFRTTLSATRPDILIIGEVTSQAGVNGFLNNVLNSFGHYSAGLYLDGPDTDNAIFFRDSLFTFISNNPIDSGPTNGDRDIYQFKLLIKASSDTLIIYGAHLKASQGTAEELQRANEIDSLRKVTNKLSPGSNYMVVGDFNLYTSSELAYQKLLDKTQTGYFLDPINTPGNWHNSQSFASIHTQSTRNEQLPDGGANGALDDRFDFILISQALKDAGGITYVPGTYKAYGNDGNHFNQSINVMPNTAVSQDIANALYYSSDHLPVYANFMLDDVVPVELISFTAKRDLNGTILSWSTATETNFSGFEIQGSNNMINWNQTTFINGSSGSSENRAYSFTDNNNYKYYRLKIVDLDGTFKYSNIAEVSEPLSFTLLQNYPNPFNPATTISYSIPSAGQVRLIIYDILGNEITVLEDNFKEAGKYNIRFNASNLASGMYLYKLEFGNNSVLKKMLVMK